MNALVVRLAGLSVPLLLLLIVALWALDTGRSFESPGLLLGLNLVFSTLVSLCVAYLLGRGFLARGHPGLLLLGCGVLIFGAAGSVGTLAGLLRPRPGGFHFDTLVTIHNTCVWLAALCHLAGVILGRRLDWALAARRLWLAGAYALALVAVGLIVTAELAGWFPPFLIADSGATPVRLFVLGSAIGVFVLTALMLGPKRRHPSAFIDWYALALLLLAVGLFGVMLQPIPGSLLGWAGRLTQYLAGVYMLVAALAAVRESGAAEAALSLGASLRPAPGARPGVGALPPRYPYFVAFVLVICATALRLAFLQDLGMRASYLVFYPAVMLTALYGGLRPGLVAAVLAAGLADWFWIAPVGSLAMTDSADVLSMAFFLLSCTLISWTAEAMHRAQARAVTAETQAGYTAERARAAQALRESLTRLSLGIEVSGIALADIDYPTGTMYLSGEAARLLGLGEGAVRVTRELVHARFHPEDRAELERRITASLDPSGPGTFSMDHRIVRPDGQVRWLSVRKQVVFDGTGAPARPLRGMLAAQDITDRKRAEEALARQAQYLRESAEQLRDADRRKDEFLAMLGHELRNPLTPILMAAEILKLRGNEDPALVQWASTTIKHQGQHLSRLVDDLLDASRVTQGKIALNRATLELGALLTHALEVGRHLVEEHAHRLIVEPAAEPLMIEGDAVRLTQVIGNLLSNAAKYTPDGGRIRVSLAREDAWAVLRVRDNGIGISAAMLPKVFALFTQAERAMDRAPGGLGIGLALVKSLVEMHGGQVAAASPGSDQGTEITVRLPLLEAAPAAVAAPAVCAPACRSPRRVMVVDDDAQVRASLEVLMTAMGHQVHLADSAAHALNLVETVHPDLMLIDIGMPEENGYVLARRLREDPACRGITLISMTGYGPDHYRDESVRAGFDHHLVKPFDLQAITDLLNQGTEPPGRHPGPRPH